MAAAPVISNWVISNPDSGLQLTEMAITRGRGGR